MEEYQLGTDLGTEELRLSPHKTEDLFSFSLYSRFFTFLLYSHQNLNGAPMQRTYKRNPLSGSLFANPNPKLLARFLLMKLSCGKAKVGLNWSDKFKSNSSLLSIVLIGAPWQQIFLLARKQKVYVEALD